MSFLPTTRRKFIRIASAAGIGALAAETTLIEPNRPRIVRQEIFLRRWPARLEGFTIALLSDFHYEPYFSVHPLRASIGMVNDLHPDLIVLTGDFVSEPFLARNHVKAAFAADPCAQLLRQMRAPYGLWAVLGNHDVVTDPNVVAGAVRGQGIHVLINQSVPVEVNGARFWLGGINDALERKADLNATLHGIPSRRIRDSVGARARLCRLRGALSCGSTTVRTHAWRPGAAAFHRCYLFASNGPQVRLGLI